MTLFGEELRRLRKRSGLSQETLAARAGLSPEAVSLLERGRRSPRMTTMRLLAEGLRLAEADPLPRYLPRPTCTSPRPRRFRCLPTTRSAATRNSARWPSSSNATTPGC